MAQPVQVIIVENPDTAERHRCWCCCCTCCHIRVAAICLMVLEMISIVGTLWIASVIDKGWVLDAVKATTGLCLAAALALLAGVICCIVAMTSYKPELVWPHIGAQVFVIVVAIAVAITEIVLVARFSETLLRTKRQSESNDWFGRRDPWSSGNTVNGQETFGGVDLKAMRRDAVDTFSAAHTGAMIAGLVTFIGFQARFIQLFLQLKRYLAERRAAYPGFVEMGRAANDADKPPQYA